MKNIVPFICLVALLIGGCTKDEPLKNGTSSPDNVVEQITKFKDNNYAAFYDENGWDESVYFANGSQFHLNMDETSGKLKNMFIWAIDSKKQMHPIVAEMNADGIPSKISYANLDVFISRCDETTLDMTVLMDNNLVFYADSVVHNLDFTQESRAWKDNNGIRNTVAVLGLVLSTSEIILSGTEIAASVVSQQYWATALGGLGLASGIADFKESYNLLFESPEAVNEDWNSVIRSLSDNSIDIGKELQNKDSKLYKMILERKVLKDLDLKLSDMKPKGLVSLLLSLLDKYFGESYNSIDQILEFIQSVYVITDLATNITEESAQVSVLCSYNDKGGVTDINMKPGMHYYKTEEPGETWKLLDDNWNNGYEYAFNLENLEEDTEYSYMGFCHELSHDWYFYGSEMNFTTQDPKDGVIVAYDNTKLTENGNILYLNVDVTAKCEAVNKQSSITDWGVYCTLNDGERLKFSIGNKYIQNTVTCSYPIAVIENNINIMSDSIVVQDDRMFGVYINKGGTITYLDKGNQILTAAKSWPTDEKAVDLGLSVKWASCNVGANSPADYGGLYGWGDPSGTLTYQPWNKNYPNYIEKKDQCIALYGGENPPADISGTALDIATAKWGAPWRLPTYSESIDLVEKCYWKETVYMGVKGLLVIGKNLNSIFLPYSGFYDKEGTTPLDRGSRVLCWTGTLVPDSHDYAYTTDNHGEGHHGTRCDGHSVRPVKP